MARVPTYVLPEDLDRQHAAVELPTESDRGGDELLAGAPGAARRS